MAVSVQRPFIFPVPSSWPCTGSAADQNICCRRAFDCDYVLKDFHRPALTGCLDTGPRRIAWQQHAATRLFRGERRSEQAVSEAYAARRGSYERSQRARSERRREQSATVRLKPAGQASQHASTPAE
jgi:hypothetical protein